MVEGFLAAERGHVELNATIEDDKLKARHAQGCEVAATVSDSVALCV